MAQLFFLLRGSSTSSFPVDIHLLDELLSVNNTPSVLFLETLAIIWWIP